jgi:hypothetical protein
MRPRSPLLLLPSKAQATHWRTIWGPKVLVAFRAWRRCGRRQAPKSWRAIERRVTVCLAGDSRSLVRLRQRLVCCAMPAKWPLSYWRQTGSVVRHSKSKGCCNELRPGFGVPSSGQFHRLPPDSLPGAVGRKMCALEPQAVGSRRRHGGRSVGGRMTDGGPLSDPLSCTEKGQDGGCGREPIHLRGTVTRAAQSLNPPAACVWPLLGRAVTGFLRRYCTLSCHGGGLRQQAANRSWSKKSHAVTRQINTFFTSTRPPNRQSLSSPSILPFEPAVSFGNRISALCQFAGWGLAFPHSNQKFFFSRRH